MFPYSTGIFIVRLPVLKDITLAVDDGEYMDLSRCYAIPIDKVSNDDIDLTGTGTFKAGLHFAAGEYKLIADPGKSGYYSIFKPSLCQILFLLHAF